jgi:hypothetical protein
MTCQVDIINKRHHLIENKIYGYYHNFDSDNPNELYDKSTSKFVYNISDLFKDD